MKAHISAILLCMIILALFAFTLIFQTSGTGADQTSGLVITWVTIARCQACIVNTFT